MSFDTVASIKRAGYCTDEFARWQQGECGTYAVAILRARPDFVFAVIGQTEDGDAANGWRETHYYAFDPATQTAYDSLGAHPMPYLGIEDGENDYIETGDSPETFGLGEAYGEFDAADLADAVAHFERNGILDNRYRVR